MKSPEVTTLPPGSDILVAEVRAFNGKDRALVSEPIRGWVSLKCLEKSGFDDAGAATAAPTVAAPAPAPAPAIDAAAYDPLMDNKQEETAEAGARAAITTAPRGAGSDDRAPSGRRSRAGQGAAPRGGGARGEGARRRGVEGRRAPRGRRVPRRRLARGREFVPRGRVGITRCCYARREKTAPARRRQNDRRRSSSLSRAFGRAGTPRCSNNPRTTPRRYGAGPTVS